MPNPRWITLGLAATLLSGLPALAANKNITESYQVLGGQYPTSERQVHVLPVGIDGEVTACAGTAHDNRKTSNEGFNRVKITIQRTDPLTGEETQEVHGKRGDLKGNKWLRCIQTGPLSAEDTVVFDYAFIDYPKPRGSTIHVRSSVSEGRMRITELRGTEAKADIGDPTQLHQRVSHRVAENGKHPKSWRQAYVVHADSVDKVQLCAGYGNNIAGLPAKGKAKFKVEIGRTDPENSEVTVEKQTLKGRLRNNKINECVEIDPVKEGDTVIADVTLTGFPRLRDNTEVDGVEFGGDQFEIRAGIGPVGMLDSELLGPPTPAGGGGGDIGGGGGGGGTTPTPTDTGQVSAAEQKAISALSKMTAIGIGTRSRGGNITWLIAHRYNCGNYMETSTIAGVYDLFVKACGARAAGGALTKSQIDAIAKFKRSIGTTGLRWESGGRVIGEYYTAATGTIHKTFSSIEAAVKWLEGQGRFR